MMDKLDKESPGPAPKAPSQQRVLHLMVRGFLVWIFVCVTLQGQDGFWAKTVDRVEAGWIKFSFLNLPLHLALTLVVSVCAASVRVGVLRIGLWAGVVNCVLIGGHVVLSVVTAG